MTLYTSAPGRWTSYEKTDEYDYDLIYYDNKRLEQTDAYGNRRNRRKQDYGYEQRDGRSRSDRQSSRARMSKKQQKRRRRARRRKQFLIIVLVILAVVVCGKTGMIDRIKASIGMISTSELQSEGYPDSLIRLYEKHPEAREFVLDYKNHINDNESDESINIAGDVTDGKIPLFIQWDERWGYKTYGDDFLAVTGCGPTALSMVCVGLTGDMNMNPYAVAKLAQADGYYVNGSGSSWDMMTGLAGDLGLSANELGLDADTIRSKLRDGHPIICIMGPGDFTSTGHFIVLTGVKSNGDVTVNDPNSRKNSDKSWNLEEIMSQMRNLWVYSRA